MAEISTGRKEDLEEKICDFLRRQKNGANLKALEIAKGVGLTRGKDVNATLYRLEGLGRLRKTGESPPLWSLPDSCVPAMEDEAPDTSISDLSHRLKSLLTLNSANEGVSAKKLARDLNKSRKDVNAQLYGMLSRGEVKKIGLHNDHSLWRHVDQDGSKTNQRFSEDYNFIARLGEGGYGAIYQMKQKLDKRDYAIKVVEYDDDEFALREVEALANFQHPNIVRYYTAWMEPSRPQLGERLEAMHVVHYCLNCLNEIRSLEERRLSYDLKPDNILIKRDGTVKIGDFGLVTTIKSKSGRSIERTKGVGTTSYMSPEQENQSSYDEKVDIFALGLIFFELLRRIGTGMERAKLWKSLRNGQLPTDFCEEHAFHHMLIKKMLSKVPKESKRPGAKDISKHLTSQPGKQSKESIIQHTNKKSCVTLDGARVPSQPKGLDGWDTLQDHGHTGAQIPAEDTEHQGSNLESMPVENPEKLGVTSFGVFGHSLTQHAAAFYRSIRERYCLSQKNVNSVVADVQQYQASLLDLLRCQIKNAFNSHGGSQKLQTAVLAVFDDFKDPFRKVSSTHLQDSSIQHFVQPVEPEEKVISQTVKGGNSSSFYYAPLFKSLEAQIFTMISFVPMRCKEGFLYDIVYGEPLRRHPLFSVRHDKIDRQTDVIEICNPLRSHATINKLLTIYYTCRNIYPKHSSKLSAISLLAIAKSRDMSKCGVDVILDRIKKDLDVLYRGVKLQRAVGERTVYEAVVSLCGDTLALNEFAGFKEGVDFALSKRRHCDCTADDMQTNFDENFFNKRTVERNLRQCFDIENAKTKSEKNNLKTIYRITRNTLVDIPGFNLIEQTAQYIMHIILEWVAGMEIKCVLKQVTFSGLLELDAFNSAKYGFPYSRLDPRRRPCPITVSTLTSNGNTLKQSSGQMLILPFLNNNIKESIFVQFIIELVEITQILFAPTISLQKVTNLKELIEPHLKSFKQLFPENNIVQKQHIISMCMRFDSKHRFFKRWALKLNFKNICKTLVQHNQRLDCSHNMNGRQQLIFSNEKKLGPASEVVNTEYVLSKLRDYIGIATSDVQTIVSLKWLILNGNKYTSHKSLIISAVHDQHLPVFSVIKDIWLVNSNLYCFESQLYDTLGFSEDFDAFEVDVPNLAQATEVVDAEKLADFTAYYVVTFKDHQYVPIWYNLHDVLELSS